jgi:hypothetical protein
LCLQINAHACTAVSLISDVSPQDALKTESELFSKYYSERKKEVQADVTYSTIPQFYFKVWYASLLLASQLASSFDKHKFHKNI